MQKKKDFLENTQNLRREVREYHKKLRMEMDVFEIAEKSAQIRGHMFESEWYQRAEIVYGYAPLLNEVDSRPFLEQALSDGKLVALPKTGAEHTMEFYQITSLSQLVEGKFHVMEPKEGCMLCTFPDPIVLVPGVAFDRRGNRYGYGGGYYDRYFARYPMAHRFALAYENQMEQVLESETTDVKMQRIYTEAAEYIF